MSRCQHGQPITLFCLNDDCNWREAGGCEVCFKKYHVHQKNNDIISLEMLEKLLRIFYIQPQIKIKSKILQEAVYNYFIAIKNQINISLDTISKIITNKLNYPYLYQNGQLNVFKKLKNKEYKKIYKKELKNFLTFSSKQTKDNIQYCQKMLYQQEVSTLNQTFQNINQAFINYSNTVQKFDHSFNLQQNFLTKIYQITASIQTFKNLQKPKQKPQKIQVTPPPPPLPQISQLPVNQQIQKQSTKQIIRQDSIKIKPSRDRRISIDTGLQINRLKKIQIGQTQQPYFNQNQKQIIEKKKKLFQLMSQPQTMLTPKATKQTKQTKQQQKQSVTTKSIQKQIILADPFTIQNNTKAQPASQQCKQQQSQITELLPLDTKKIQSDITLNKNDIQRIQKMADKQQAENKQKNNNLFQYLITQGINLPQIILHTILPRQKSKQKLYQDTYDVKQRKIKIPIKKFQKQQQIYSPLLRKKRKKIQQNQQITQPSDGSQKKMDQIQFFCQTKPQDQIKQDDKGLTPKKQQQSEKLILKDKQADSLALLLQSLHLPAEKAIPLLQAALKYAYNNLSAAQYLSYLYLQIEQPKQCLQLCNKILEQLQDSPQANQLSIHINNNKAAALNMLGRYSQSIGILQKCLEYSKRDIYYKNLGDAYFSISIYEKAIFNYENALKMNNQMEETFYNLAVCYYMQEHLNEAQLNISEAMKINPKNQQYERLNQQILVKIQV